MESQESINYLPPPFFPPSHHSPRQQHGLPPPQQHQQPQSGPRTPELPPTSYHHFVLPPMDLSAHTQPVLSAPPPFNQRDGGSIERCDHQNQSDLATPVNRSYSHDVDLQRSSATAAGPESDGYLPGSGQDGAPPRPGSSPRHCQMERGQHHGYTPPDESVTECRLPPLQKPVLDHHTYSQYPMPSPSIYGGGPNFGPAASSIYRPMPKQPRATQACEQCRSRKQKCDGGTPCPFCKEKDLTCQYRQMPPTKTDKNMEKLLSSTEAHTRRLSELISKIDGLGRRLQTVEHIASFVSNPIAGPQQDASIVEEEGQPTKRKPQLEDHRTAPHKLLLLWPTVRSLLRRAGVEHNDGYVMEAEDRGVLDLWTRSEDMDENDGTQTGWSASPARSDETGEQPAATPNADSLWGVESLPTANSEGRRSKPQGASGLKANGQIDLDKNTVNALYDSYMSQIHIMHPILDKRRLRKMFDNFIKRYSTGGSGCAFAAGTPTNIDSDQRPVKRQRSHGADDEDRVYAEDDLRRDMSWRSPGNAIIYLVMALGKICLHKDPLPAVEADRTLQGNLVVPHHMLATCGQTASLPFSASTSPTSARTTTQPTSESCMRNMDVIPGIAYYAKAAEILGDQGDGNDLVHAQMFLLAGLYKGQLARVKESMSWFTVAGRAIIILLDRYKLYNVNYWEAFDDITTRFKTGQTRIKDTRQNLIVLASWSCLQLESDILAELRLPSSGIQSIEDWLLMPHKAEDEWYQEPEPDGVQEDDGNILWFYTAQLYLRRKLNEIQRQIYGAECTDQSLERVQEMIKGHQDVLQEWRASLPFGLRWDDGDDPACDILNARLRGKYYGARYIINRPFLDYALHIMPGLEEGCPMEAVARDGYGNPRDKAEIHLFHAIKQMEVSDIWQGAQYCIDAAMHSTVAFDGVPDRLITTNIHGTAHAQFGNMLVLCASLEADHIKQLISTDLLKARLQRTITFLRKLVPISPTCRADCGILEKLNALLFPGTDGDIYLRRPSQ